MLTADSGYRVQLYDFDMAGYDNTDYTIYLIEVLNSDGTPLYSQNNMNIEGDSDGPGHTHFDFTSSPLMDDQLTREAG